MAVTVDTRGLQRKLHRTRRAVHKAQRRAKRDAARQTKTAMSKDVRKEINLRVKEINKRITVKPKNSGNRQEVRTRYGVVPAHYFKGWTYTHARRGGGFARQTETRTSLLKNLRKGDQTGLKVRFYLSKPPLVFPKAFRTAKVGHGRVFIQRKRQARYPLTDITGPPPWNVVDENFERYIPVAEAAYRRRLAYWRNRELQRVGARN